MDEEKDMKTEEAVEGEETGMMPEVTPAVEGGEAAESEGAEEGEENTDDSEEVEKEEGEE